jgi:indolepyruvate ferredoxin oxidoreductase alpha subunit
MKRMLLPARARLKHIEVEKRTKKLEKWSSRFPYNHIIEGKNSIGVVASGIAYENGRSVFPDAWFLKITTSFPFPRELFMAFASKVETIYILEENDPIIETCARLAAPDKKIIGKDTFPLTGEMTPDVIRHALGEKDITPKLDVSAIPRRPPTLCSGCPHSAAFFTLGTQKVTVSGDIGCYTLGGLPPLNAMDTCVDMGASITVLLGMEKALEKAGKKNKQVAVIGDSTFFHSGLTGLLDIVYNKGKSTVIILDNSITAMTGHQHNPGSGQTLMGEETPRVDIVKLVKEGFGIANTFAIDGYDVKGIRTLIKQEIEKDEPSVIVIQRPCALLFRGARWSPMTVDRDKCIYCKTCLKVGCPAITSKDEKSHIVDEMCKGCTVCAQLCPVQAISFKDPDGPHIYSTSLEDNTGGK